MIVLWVNYDNPMPSESLGLYRNADYNSEERTAFIQWLWYRDTDVSLFFYIFYNRMSLWRESIKCLDLGKELEHYMPGGMKDVEQYV